MVITWTLVANPQWVRSFEIFDSTIFDEDLRDSIISRRQEKAMIEADI
jgi:hypothetical protein